MTIGAPDQLCKCPVHCTPGPVGRLAALELRRRAAEYAAALVDNDTIDDDIEGADRAYVAPFREYLYEALIAAEFRIEVKLDPELHRVVTIVHKQGEQT